MFTLRPIHYVVMIFAAALTATTISMRVGVRADRVNALHKQMKADDARIQLLGTELAYLSSPQRIQALVSSHRPDLNTPKTEQYLMSVSDVLPHAVEQTPSRVQFTAVRTSTEHTPVERAQVEQSLPRMHLQHSQSVVAYQAEKPAGRLNADTIATIELAADHDTQNWNR